MSDIDLVAAHYDAAARGDLAGMTADFDPRITWVEAAGFALAGTYTGPEEIAARVFGAIAAEWRGFGMHVDEYVAQTGTVIALGRYRATHRSSGRELDARTVHIWRVRGDKLVGFEQLTDTAIVEQASQPAEEAAA